MKPAAALPGGEIALIGSGFGARNHTRPQVQFGVSDAVVMLASENRLIASVPEGATGGAVRAAGRFQFFDRMLRGFHKKECPPMNRRPIFGWMDFATSQKRRPVRRRRISDAMLLMEPLEERTLPR